MNLGNEIHEPQIGDVYTSKRTEVPYQVIFISEDIIVMKKEATADNINSTFVHRMSRRHVFELDVREGRYEYQPEEDLGHVEKEEDWTDVDYVGEETANALKDAGFYTVRNVREAETKELLQIDGVGAKVADSLLQYAN